MDIASEFRYRDPILGKNDLVVLISQSGETADTLAALRLAKERHAHTLAIVNVPGSSIAREADDVLYTWAGPEIAVASTKGVPRPARRGCTCWGLSSAFCTACSRRSRRRRFAAILKEAPAQIRQALRMEPEVEACAQALKDAQHVFFIGRGTDYALSMESSLKLKEVSYIHCEAYAAGELKHGTISLIEDGTPVIAVATRPQLLPKTVSNLEEVRSRGGKGAARLPRGATRCPKTSPARSCACPPRGPCSRRFRRLCRCSFSPTTSRCCAAATSISRATLQRA